MTDTPYFTVAEARAADPTLANAYSDSAIEDARALVEEEFEHICGVAFVTRTATAERYHGTGTTSLLLRPKIQAITAIRAYSDGATFEDWTVTDIGALTVTDYGVVITPRGFPYGVSNIAVTYTHGHASIPLAIKSAAIQLCRRELTATKSGIPDRATGWTGPDSSGNVFRLDQPSTWKFGVPNIDSVLSRYSMRVVGIA